MKKYFLLTFLLATIAFCLLLYFSPFKLEGGQYKINSSVEVTQPRNVVFQYMSNSGNAAKWSSYVNHITTLNADKIKDGEIGSQRRCFKNKNEQGIVWDEEILNVIPDSFRELSIYNTKEFPVMIDNLHTAQVYAEKGNSKTTLSLVLYLKRNPSVLEWLKFKIFSYKVKQVFANNLRNIKKILESK